MHVRVQISVQTVKLPAGILNYELLISRGFCIWLLISMNKDTLRREVFEKFQQLILHSCSDCQPYLSLALYTLMHEGQSYGKVMQIYITCSNTELENCSQV